LIDCFGAGPFCSRYEKICGELTAPPEQSVPVIAVLGCSARENLVATAIGSSDIGAAVGVFAGLV
jgi:hypothetical protein